MPEAVVLLVEDDRAVAEGIAWVLRADGFRVETLNTGSEVLGVVAELEPEVVILDVSLPDIDGVKVGTLLRQTRAHLPIIFTTGFDATGVLENFANDGRTFVLQKPFDVSELVELIRWIRST